MDNFLEEVNDEIRQQKLTAFWKENGSWIIGGAIMAVIMTAGLTFWRGYESNRNMQETAALVNVLKSGDAEKLSLYAKDSGKDHAVFAKFAEAKIYAEKEDSARAVAVYDEIADTSGINREWRDLAKLLSVAQRFDSAKPDDLRSDIDDLLGKSVWRFSAREMSALLYARENKMKEAADEMMALSTDTAAPQDVRLRASTLYELYLGMTKQ